MVNPFVKNRKLLLAYTGIWFFILISHIVILYFVLSIGFNNSVIDGLVFNVLYFFFGLGLWYTVSFNSLENYTSLKLLTNHIAAAVISSGFWTALGYYILTSFNSSDRLYERFLTQSVIWRFLIGMFLYIATVAVDYVIIYYNNFQEKQLREAELNALVKEAELKSLKYQINPHFIFNSLNSISSLTLSDPKKAQEMTIKLSSFLRSTLSKNEKQKNKLSEEINNAKLYLDIEKVRFDDKFDFIEEVQPACKEMEVPSMILQPLFENAIKHGVYESLEKVIIKMKCGMEKDYFKITVENTFDPEAIPRKGEGIGIRNIQNRLKLIYNQDNLAITEKIGNLFRVNIYIPV